MIHGRGARSIIEMEDYMKKIITGIIYSIVSVFWLFFAVLFTSALWLESPGSKDWEEDAMFIPIGIIMLVIWAISLVTLILRFKSTKNVSDTNADISQ